MNYLGLRTFPGNSIFSSDGIFTLLDGDFTFTLQPDPERMKPAKREEVQHEKQGSQHFRIHCVFGRHTSHSRRSVYPADQSVTSLNENGIDEK